MSYVVGINKRLAVFCIPSPITLAGNHALPLRNLRNLRIQHRFCRTVLRTVNVPEQNLVQRGGFLSFDNCVDQYPARIGGLLLFEVAKRSQQQRVSSQTCSLLFRGKAPAIFLAQPEGLGRKLNETERAKGPAVCTALEKLAKL